MEEGVLHQRRTRPMIGVRFEKNLGNRRFYIYMWEEGGGVKQQRAINPKDTNFETRRAQAAC